MKNQKSVLLGLTGGKKSTVAAYLLLKQGYEVVGCSFLMGDFGSTCSLSGVDKAKEICKQLGIIHTTIDLRLEFKEKIILPLIGARLSGEDFNPCFDCNILKMETLLKKANDKNIDFIATGHIANIINDPSGLKLYQGKQEEFDQSFFLSGLRENLLEKLILPLGKLSRNEIDKIAISLGEGIGEIKNPKELCIRDLSSIIPIIEKQVPPSLRPTGLIINEETGISLGPHNGIYNFKLGMPDQNIYNNFSIVGFDIYKKNVLVRENFQFIQDKIEVIMFSSFLDIDLTGPLHCTLAMGPKERKLICTVFLENNGYAVVKLEKPIEGPIEKGKLVVFYEPVDGSSRLIATAFVSKVGKFINNQKEEGYFIN